MASPTSFGGRLRSDRRGAAALEFAVVALVFIIMVFGCIEVAYDLFVQTALDSAVQTAARSVQTGTARGTSGETSATFAAAAVCPALSGLLQCSLLTIGVETIASGYNFYTNPSPLTYGSASSSGGAICTGVGGQMMLLTAWYAGPSFVGSLVPSFSTRINGSLVHLTSSSVGFVNEWFSGGQTAGTGC
jgi:Flp pilus assembly protein TadG